MRKATRGRKHGKKELPAWLASRKRGDSPFLMNNEAYESGKLNAIMVKVKEVYYY